MGNIGSKIALTLLVIGVGFIAFFGLGMVVEGFAKIFGFGFVGAIKLIIAGLLLIGGAIAVSKVWGAPQI